MLSPSTMAFCYKIGRVVIRIYNRDFKLGVSLSLLIFAILNIVSYVTSQRAYDQRDVRLPRGVFVWGFPFTWASDGSRIQLIPNEVLNLAVIVLCCFTLGFLFRYFGRKS